MNVNADAVSHIQWEDYDWHIEDDTVQTLISNATQGTALIEAYSCNIQATETLDMQKDSKVMSQKDWIIAKSQDPVIREIKYLIFKDTLKGHKVYSQDTQTLKQYLQQHSHLVLQNGVLYR